MNGKTSRMACDGARVQKGVGGKDDRLSTRVVHRKTGSEDKARGAIRTTAAAAG